MLVDPKSKSLIVVEAEIGEFEDIDEAEAFIREKYPNARIIRVTRHIVFNDTLIIVADPN